MSRIMTKPTSGMCTQRRLRSAWASTQFDQSRRCLHEEILGPQLPIQHSAKTLTRLGGCSGWSESSLGAHSFCWFCHEVAHMTACKVCVPDFHVPSNNISVKSWSSVWAWEWGSSTPYTKPLRRRFFMYHHAMKYPHTNIILSSFRIPFVLKSATKNLKIGLQIKF